MDYITLLIHFSVCETNVNLYPVIVLWVYILSNTFDYHVICVDKIKLHVTWLDLSQTKFSAIILTENGQCNGIYRVWIITVTSNERHDVLNHRQIDYSVKLLAHANIKEISKLHVTGALWGNPPVDSPPKGPVARKAFPCDDVNMWSEKIVSEAEPWLAQNEQNWR